MRTTVWVGRVKSTCAPQLLQEAFSKAGTVVKVETGFAGFAFVEFETEDDADKACKTMAKAHIPHVGEIRVQKATYRGYQDACAKRDEYWRARGHDGDKGAGGSWVKEGSRPRRSPSRRRGRRGRDDSRSRSRRRSRSGASASPRSGRQRAGSDDSPPRRRGRSYSARDDSSASSRSRRSRSRSRSNRSGSRRRSRSPQGEKRSRPAGAPPSPKNSSDEQEEEEQEDKPQPREDTNSANATAEEEPETPAPPAVATQRAAAAAAAVAAVAAPSRNATAGPVGGHPAANTAPPLAVPVKLEPRPNEGTGPRRKEVDKRPPLRRPDTIAREARAEQADALPRGSDQRKVAEEERRRQASSAVALWEEDNDMGSGGGVLSCTDRASAVCFFDGSSAPDLLLEAAGLLKVPDFFVPNLLNGFPHGFQGLSQDGAVKLSKVLADVCSADGRLKAESSVEVRQALLVDKGGQRLLRKSLVINGVLYTSEDKLL